MNKGTKVHDSVKILNAFIKKEQFDSNIYYKVNNNICQVSVYDNNLILDSINQPYGLLNDTNIIGKDYISQNPGSPGLVSSSNIMFTGCLTPFNTVRSNIINITQVNGRNTAIKGENSIVLISGVVNAANLHIFNRSIILRANSGNSCNIDNSFIVSGTPNEISNITDTFYTDYPNYYFGNMPTTPNANPGYLYKDANGFIKIS